MKLILDNYKKIDGKKELVLEGLLLMRMKYILSLEEELIIKGILKNILLYLVVV